MDLKRIQEFLAVQRQGSLSGAARALSLSEATLSARLGAFETQLGVRLFERKSTGMTLTADGERFLVDALQLEQSLLSLTSAVRDGRDDASGCLTIAIAGGQLPMHLGPYLDLFFADHPHLSLRLTDDTAIGIREGLESGAVDLYAAPLTDEAVFPGIRKIVLSVGGQFVIVPRNHPLAERDAVTLQELENSTFLLSPPTCQSVIRDYQQATLLSSGIRYRVEDTGSTPGLYHLLVPVGRGILLSPCPCSRFNLPPNSVALILRDAPLTIYSCLLHAENRLSTAARSFLTGYLDFYRRGGVAHDNHGAL